MSEEQVLRQILGVLNQVSFELNDLKHTVRGIAAAQGAAAREGEMQSRAREDKPREVAERREQREQFIRKTIKGMRGNTRNHKFFRMVDAEVKRAGFEALTSQDNTRWNLDGSNLDYEEEDEGEWGEWPSMEE